MQVKNQRLWLRHRVVKVLEKTVLALKLICLLHKNVGWTSLAERRNKHWYLFIFKAPISTLIPLYHNDAGLELRILSNMLSWRTYAYDPTNILHLESQPFHSVLLTHWMTYMDYGQFRAMTTGHSVAVCNWLSWFYCFHLFLSLFYPCAQLSNWFLCFCLYYFKLSIVVNVGLPSMIYLRYK